MPISPLHRILFFLYTNGIIVFATEKKEKYVKPHSASGVSGLPRVHLSSVCKPDAKVHGIMACGYDTYSTLISVTFISLFTFNRKHYRKY